jgi:predicted enzyme related to lactoylglutathione lyase
MGAPVVHFEINARDGKKAQTFYADLFGWHIDANNPIGYGLVNTGVKTGINGGIGQVEAGKLPFVTFYAAVADPQASLDKAVSLGGKVVLPVTEIPNMVTLALFADPEGNIVGIVKDTMPPPKPRPRRSAARKTRRATARRRSR